MPSSDTALRSCLIQVNVSSTGPSLLQSFESGQSGHYFYYPAVTMDGTKNAYFTYSHSSSGVHPEARAAQQLAGAAANTLSGILTLRSGQRKYAGGSGVDRWGDYCGAGPDPTTSTSTSGNSAWVACEYSKSSSYGNNWGTVGARLTP